MTRLPDDHAMLSSGPDRFQLYLDQVKDCVIVVDTDSSVVSASESTRRLFEMDLSGHRLADRIASGTAKQDFLDWLAKCSAVEAHAFTQHAGSTPQAIDLQLKVEGARLWCPVQGSAFCCLMDDRVRCVLTLRDVKSQLERESSLIRDATTDPLTGLLNRRGFQAELERRLGQPLGVAILDVDDFKQVNDRRGHAEGDQTLRDVAAVLNRAFPTSTVARLGGDEFGVVLSLKGQSVEESAAIEQQFSQVVQAVAASESSALKTSTLSCGIALDFCGTQTARELLGQADQLLYRSKVAGKNRVARSE